MKRLFNVGLSMLVLAMVLIALSYAALRAKGISNPSSAAGRAVRSETRPISAGINSIDLAGPIDLVLRRGATPSMKVNGEQRLLSNVATSADGTTLHIGPKGMLFHHRQPLQVELVLPSLVRVEVHGNGDSKITGFSGDSFILELTGSGDVSFTGRYKQVQATVNGSGDLDINAGNSDSVVLEMVGSGRIAASGNTKFLRADLSGSGDIDAEHLSADKASVNLQGSGQSTIFVRDATNLSLRGSGDIHVHGNPRQRDAQKNGSGDIIWH
ncbi:head GIN domain-containing protein [Janthinobacterium sp. CAN_S7]|uniref:head GIN domain-containing protein n=1 Tax=Janthinobacterium sp. CAN_S7 TaxID=3071704 RepID=UPI00319D939E